MKFREAFKITLAICVVLALFLGLVLVVGVGVARLFGSPLAGGLTMVALIILGLSIIVQRLEA